MTQENTEKGFDSEGEIKKFQAGMQATKVSRHSRLLKQAEGRPRIARMGGIPGLLFFLVWFGMGMFYLHLFYTNSWSSLITFIILGFSAANIVSNAIHSRIDALVELLQEKGLLGQDNKE